MKRARTTPPIHMIGDLRNHTTRTIQAATHKTMCVMHRNQTRRYSPVVIFLVPARFVLGDRRNPRKNLDFMLWLRKGLIAKLGSTPVEYGKLGLSDVLADGCAFDSYFTNHRTHANTDFECDPNFHKSDSTV